MTDTVALDLDRLQRAGFVPPGLAAGQSFTTSPVDLRMLMRVDGIGRSDKASNSATPRDLLVSLCGYHVPLAFMLTCDADRVSLRIGTWLSAGSSPEAVRENGRLVQTALRGLYPVVDMTVTEPVSGSWPLGGLVMGVPTPKAPDTADAGHQIDRLLQALQGLRWGALILAQPIGESALRGLKLRLVNELRGVQTETKFAGVPRPLADHYSELLGIQLRAFADAEGTGAWRTAVYVLGDHDSYPHAASLWRGVYSGNQSLPEPIRVWDRDDVPMLADAWSLPNPPHQGDTDGRYRPPFDHQTLHSSTQLAAYIDFPTTETNGLTITQVPAFDTVPPPAPDGSLTLGTVVERQRVRTTPYAIHPDKLTRHTFVAGVTGSGKTNTVFNLLREAAERGIPFLVLEPAKSEYRVLLRDPGLGERIIVLTPGNENVSPMRLNPFEVPDGIPVAVHIDLLRSVFNASFGMWTPLPQILERCLHDVYIDRGWDVTADTNRRLDGSNRSESFPTLTDLVAKVESTVPNLGYEDKVAGDLQAALGTRLNSLRTTGKGRMLDTRHWTNWDELLGRPVVIELEGMGDDDDKAFMMGLIMIRLAEYRRTHGDAQTLRHLLVIEEAHRLLTATTRPQGGGENVEADARGKAVETFAHLLSEVRAYGQGVVIVDQVPSKLSPDVVKNTNLKIAHRIVASDDRETLGGAMAMTQRHTAALATLPVGRAAVFTDGEDAPLLLQIPLGKGGSGTWPSHQEVRSHTSRPDAATGIVPDLRPTTDCDQHCLASPMECETARRLLEAPAVHRSITRLVLSAVQTQDALTRNWPDIVTAVAPRCPPWMDLPALFHCLAQHGARGLANAWGARAGWTYAQTAAIAELVNRALSDHLEGRDGNGSMGALRTLLLDLQGSAYGPYQGCPRIWADRAGPCLCRLPVADLVASGAFNDTWTAARATDRTAPSNGQPALWEVCRRAAYELVEFPDENSDAALDTWLGDVADSIALCFGQQMLSNERWAHPGIERRALSEFLTAAGRPGVTTTKEAVIDSDGGRVQHSERETDGSKSGGGTDA
ncbi:ATP-binding protein [Streptomyces sp. NPDC057238]|uniref:ATP-binding protein n=1 Tax=Streptomyces sp. NPDC057238 TaxID=3346060 RepID=UPI003644FE5C